MTGAKLELVDARFDGPEAGVLFAEVQAYYVRIYGGEDRTPIDADDFAPPGGAFLLGYLDGELVGCAALRRHDDGTVELKRMYVRPAYRRRGLARQLLSAIEDRARALGYRRLLLETGSKQPEAVALYESHGYRRAENFGFHHDSPSVRSFVRTL